ncbi:MAG: hypothetical protein ACOYN0_05445 [Phycisphaerales bacterium]
MILLLAAKGPIAPAWAMVPVGFVALVVIGLHVLHLMRSDMPPSRRRIRIATGLLMMFTCPLFVAAMSLIDPGTQQKLFAMTGILTMSLVTLVFGLACFDMLNNVRLYRAEQREIRRAAALKRDPARGPRLSSPPDPPAP